MKHSFLYDSIHGNSYHDMDYPFLRDVVKDQIVHGVKSIATYRVGNMYARATVASVAQQVLQPQVQPKPQPSITPYQNVTPAPAPVSAPATPTKFVVTTPTSTPPTTPTLTRPTSVTTPKTPVIQVDTDQAMRDFVAALAPDLQKRYDEQYKHHILQGSSPQLAHKAAAFHIKLNQVAAQPAQKGPAVEAVETQTEELYRKMRETFKPLPKEDLVAMAANAADPFKDRSKIRLDDKPPLKGEIEMVSMLSGIDAKKIIPINLDKTIYPYIIVENPNKPDAKVVFGNVAPTAVEKFFDKMEGGIENMLYKPVKVQNKKPTIDENVASKLTRPSLDNQLEAYQALGKMFTVEGKDSKKQYGIYVREMKLENLNTYAVEEAKRMRISLAQPKPGTPKKNTPQNSPKRNK